MSVTNDEKEQDDLWPTDVHFGDVDKPLPDWRNNEAIVDDENDDEELSETSEDVIEILGFDPKEIDKIKESDNDDDNSN